MCIHTYFKGKITVKKVNTNLPDVIDSIQAMRTKARIVFFILILFHSDTQSNVHYLFMCIHRVYYLCVYIKCIYTLYVFASTNQRRLKLFCIRKIQIKFIRSEIFRILGHHHFSKHFNWQCATCNWNITIKKVKAKILIFIDLSKLLQILVLPNCFLHYNFVNKL